MPSGGSMPGAMPYWVGAAPSATEAGQREQVIPTTVPQSWKTSCD